MGRHVDERRYSILYEPACWRTRRVSNGHIDCHTAFASKPAPTDFRQAAERQAPSAYRPCAGRLGLRPVRRTAGQTDALRFASEAASGSPGSRHPLFSPEHEKSIDSQMIMIIIERIRSRDWLVTRKP
jgi:hypothetical protein